MQWTRRTLLGGIASASVPLAGCSLDSPSDGESNGNGGSGEFERVAVENRTLLVDLGEVGSVETVNVIAPDGTAYASKEVAQGTTTVEFEIGLSYTPGEYRVVGSAGDSTVAEATLTIAPDLAITEVGVGANHPERMPEELNFSDEQALVELSNTGSGPGSVGKLLILGDVPNPTTELSQEGNDESGIYDTEDGYGNQDRLVIPSGQSVLVYSTSKPFLFTGDGVECESEPQTGTFEIILSVGSGDEPLRDEYSIEYSASEEPDGCEISVGDGGD